MSDVIAAAAEPINAWMRGPATTNFDAMREEVVKVCDAVRNLEYKGPNAITVQTNTEAAMRGLGEGSQQFMMSACEMIAAAAGIILGSGGHTLGAAAFDNAFAEGTFTIPDGNLLQAEDFSLSPSQFTAAISTAETSFAEVQTLARALITTLQDVDQVAWQGAARQAAETAFETEIGTAEMSVNAAGRIETLALDADGGDAANLMQAFASNMTIIADTLWAQLNSAQDADTETAAKIASA